jgi:hypothetical protein
MAALLLAEDGAIGNDTAGGIRVHVCEHKDDREVHLNVANQTAWVSLYYCDILVYDRE